MTAGLFADHWVSGSLEGAMLVPFHVLVVLLHSAYRAFSCSLHFLDSPPPSPPLRCSSYLGLGSAVPAPIFVAGGYLRRSLDVLECYDPLTLTWSILPPLAVPKSGLGAAYFGM